MDTSSWLNSQVPKAGIFHLSIILVHNLFVKLQQATIDQRIDCFSKKKTGAVFFQGG